MYTLRRGVSATRTINLACGVLMPLLGRRSPPLLVCRMPSPKLIGLSLVWLIRSVAFIGLTIYRFITAIGSVFGKQFSKIIGDPSDDADAAGKGLYRPLIRWALDSPMAMILLAAAALPGS